jgi:hypothetical protein
MFKSKYKYISKTHNNKARYVINSNRFRWPQALNSLISESETGAKDKNSDDGRVERQQDTDCSILTENALKIHQQHHKILLNAHYQPQAEEK